jgi:hypothetical protein
MIDFLFALLLTFNVNCNSQEYLRIEYNGIHDAIYFDIIIIETKFRSFEQEGSDLTNSTNYTFVIEKTYLKRTIKKHFNNYFKPYDSVKNENDMCTNDYKITYMNDNNEKMIAYVDRNQLLKFMLVFSKIVNKRYNYNNDKYNKQNKMIIEALKEGKTF